MKASAFLGVIAALFFQQGMTTMAKSTKTRPSGHVTWSSTQQTNAADEGWALQWTFLPDGKCLGLRAFPTNKNASIAEVNLHIRRNAEARSPLHIAALRAIVHSKV